MAEYPIPPWMTAGGNFGALYGGLMQQSRQIGDQEQNQAFNQNRQSQEMALQQQEWQAKQKAYTAQAEQLGKKYQAQDALNKAISVASQLPAGSAERAQAVNSAYLQYGLEAGVGGPAMAQVIKNVQAPKSILPDQIEKIPLGVSQPGMPPVPSGGPPNFPGMATATGIRNPNNGRLSFPPQLNKAPTTTPTAPSQINALPIIGDDGNPLEGQFGTWNGKTVQIHNRPKAAAAKGPTASEIMDIRKIQAETEKFKMMLANPRGVKEYAVTQGLTDDEAKKELQDLIKQNTDAVSEFRSLHASGSQSPNAAPPVAAPSAPNKADPVTPGQPFKLSNGLNVTVIPKPNAPAAPVAAPAATSQRPPVLPEPESDPTPTTSRVRPIDDLIAGWKTAAARDKAEEERAAEISEGKSRQSKEQDDFNEAVKSLIYGGEKADGVTRYLESFTPKQRATRLKALKDAAKTGKINDTD